MITNPPSWGQTLAETAPIALKGEPKRILLMLPGTAFSGGVKAVEMIAEQIAAAHRQMPLEIVVIVGGGNYCPKSTLETDGVDVVTAERMAMLPAASGRTSQLLSPP